MHPSLLQSPQTRRRSNLRGIQATSKAFAAIRSDGTVATWGDADAGGESGYVQEQRPGVVKTGGMKKQKEGKISMFRRMVVRWY